MMSEEKICLIFSDVFDRTVRFPFSLQNSPHFHIVFVPEGGSNKVI